MKKSILIMMGFVLFAGVACVSLKARLKTSRFGEITRKLHNSDLSSPELLELRDEVKKAGGAKELLELLEYRYKKAILAEKLSTIREEDNRLEEEINKLQSQVEEQAESSNQ